MARVTLITPYFWPEVTANVPLMTSLAEDLVSFGHSVTVITSLPSRNVDAKVREDFLTRRGTEETYCGAKVIRFPNPFSSRKGALAKLLEGFVFTVWTMYATLRIRRETDVFFVYSNPPLLSLPVSIVSGQVPIIYNLQDLFPESAIADGILKDGMLANLLRFLERKTYERSTVVAVIGQSFAEHVKKCAPGSKVAVTPNWVDADRVRRVGRERNSLLASLDLSDSFVALYAGNMGFAQNLDVIVDAAEILKDRSEIKFLLVGDGQHKDAIAARIRELRLTNVFMLPMQPQELVSEVYSMGDVGIVTVRAGRERSSIPSKTWTIMSCSSPVVACVGKDSDLGQLLLSRNLGVVVPPDDPHELAQSIIRLYEDRDLQRSLSARGRQYVQENISRQAITSVFNEMIADLIRR